MLTPRRVSILSVPSMNLVCIKSHNPHSSPYSAVRLQLPSRSRHVYCHTPPPSTMYIAVLPCRICYVVPHRTEAWNSLQRMTTVLNRPILHWPLTHYYTTCMFPANFMHYTESDDQKLGGTNTLLVPPTKKLSSPVPIVVAPMDTGFVPKDYQ